MTKQMFDWNNCETQDEAVEVMIDGLAYISRQTCLEFIASIIYEEGFEFDEIRKVIEEVDGSVYNIPRAGQDEDLCD